MGVNGCIKALSRLAPARLSALRRVATIESIGSSTRIEGSHLSDRQVERLLANLSIKPFASRDEQEVAGYAEVINTIFSAWAEIPLTENHIRQLHRDLLRYSIKMNGIGVNIRPLLTALPHLMGWFSKLASSLRQQPPLKRQA